jgi:NTE family protein
MADPKRRKSHEGLNRPPFECIALLLQGGGALGAYQAGVYQALCEAELDPDWVAGISIGAINAAIIAGNARQERIGKLRKFWEGVSANPVWNFVGNHAAPFLKGTDARLSYNQLSASQTLMSGVPGFFAPRFPPPLVQPRGSIDATSYYDTSALKSTLESVVDFERINANEMRLSVGAVNVASGNFVYFDSELHQIRAEHVMASGALPPGFPAVEIEGEHYWDGGLVSNTPLQWVLQYGPRQDTLAFEVDLWSARGDFPQSMAEVATRQKEVMYSSRTRENTDRFVMSQRIRHALAALLPLLPAAAGERPEYKFLEELADHKVYDIVHLIYRARQYEGDSKDYEFSRLSMEEHWHAGYQDTVRTLRHPRALARPTNHEGFATFDIDNDGDE